jgi:hypothetical protein
VDPEHFQRRLALFDQTLGFFPPGHLVDLGAGHGRFARWAATQGWRVTAVDARTVRFPRDRFGVSWVQSDVRDVDLSRFDVVACLGLFYHLSLDDQIDLLQRCTAPLILDTHVGAGEHAHPVSAVVDAGAYRGVWFREGDFATSSFGNPESFWPTPESLYEMLHDCGFPLVLTATPWHRTDRTFFVALPQGYRPRWGAWQLVQSRARRAAVAAYSDLRTAAGAAKRRVGQGSTT